MFRKNVSFPDLSTDLRDPNIDWQPTTFRTFSYPSDITCVASLPGALLAIGSNHGSICIFGSPGVELELTLDEPSPVKFLQFAPLSHHLVCADGHGHLHVWDLRTSRRPKKVSNTSFPYPISSLTISPSHNQVFVGLDKVGEVRTFDLECLRKSPYTIPNLWKAYSESMPANRVGLTEPVDPSRGIIVDVVPHPRDLNLLFVVYMGGPMLYNLTEKRAVRTYEFILAPGVPGGTGYHDKNTLMVDRYPAVTSFAIHPCGHFFVLGHDDGCMSFWMVEDGDQPVLVSTCDEVDVGQVDPDRLEEVFRSGSQQPNPPTREPVYRVAWSGSSGSSDPRGGQTTLAILGGLESPDNGITALLLPPFNPPTPPPVFQANPHEYWRTAIKERLVPANSYFYPTPSVVQDFCIISRDTPHFSGSFNPVAILFVLEMPNHFRVCDAFQYPPPSFEASQAPESQDTESEDDLSSTLREMMLTSDAPKSHLPLPMAMASSGVMGGNILAMDRDEYASLTSHPPRSGGLSLNSGAAWYRESLEADLKLAKYQPHRVLLTKHSDLSIQFHDMSATLLIGTPASPIQNHFPCPMPQLTVKLNALFLDPSVASKLPPGEFVAIQDVCYASEAEEAAVVLSAGQIILFRIPFQQHTQTEEAVDSEITLLHSESLGGSPLRPLFMFTPENALVTACALSDVGFVAAALADSSLVIIDLRGPRVCFRKLPREQSKRQSVLHLHGGSDPYTSLKWTICRVENDPTLHLRLIAANNHEALGYTLSQNRDHSWGVAQEPIHIQSVSQPIPNGIFVFDLQTAKPAGASRSLFARAIRGDSEKSTYASLIVGQQEAKCIANLTGDRIAKVDWPSKAGSAVHAQMVEKLGSHSLIVATDSGEILVYSLPHLDLISRFPSPTGTTNISFDTSGDFISWKAMQNGGPATEATYGTLFNSRRVAHPPEYVDLTASLPSFPPQPSPIPIGPNSIVGSWFSMLTETATTGAAIDELLGGTNRPIIDRREPDVEASIRKPSNQVPEEGFYNRITSAMSERGERLGELETHVNALQEGAQGMVSQAKKLAATQAVRSKFGFGW